MSVDIKVVSTVAKWVSCEVQFVFEHICYNVHKYLQQHKAMHTGRNWFRFLSYVVTQLQNLAKFSKPIDLEMGSYALEALISGSNQKQKAEIWIVLELFSNSEVTKPIDYGTFFQCEVNVQSTSECAKHKSQSFIRASPRL